MWLIDNLEKHGKVRLGVAPTPTKQQRQPPDQPAAPEVLDIYCEKLRWRDGTLKPIIVAENDELALALKPEWLPGQQQAVNWYEGVIRQLVGELEQHFKKKGLDP
jgi:hypothetical protein